MHYQMIFTGLVIFSVFLSTFFVNLSSRDIKVWSIIYKFLTMHFWDRVLWDRLLRRREIEDRVELLYEIDEKGQQVVVKSIESTSSAYLRFTNKTSRAVDVWWRDFQGAKKHYVRLETGTYFDINTFMTHPWEFTDVVTKESCVINNKPLFRPPRNIGGMMYRTNWNITIRVRSLRDTALLALAQHLHDPDAAYALGLPQVLADELQKLILVFRQHCSNCRPKY